MAAATNQQVQTFCNERTRVVSEIARTLLLFAEDNNATIEDVYANLTDSPDWEDNREDGPPHLLVPGDVLAIHTFCFQLAKIMRGTLGNDEAKVAACNDVAAQLPKVLLACVRPVRNT